ncbi:MAG: hypothetical protein ABEH56_01150 [Salinirussus sp.]
MAHLTERGQLLLITALVLAVAFVSLSLIVNTAIYSENLASQEDPSATNALQGRHETEVMSTDLLASVNENNNSENATLGDGFRGGLANSGTYIRKERARRGAIVDTTLEASVQNNGTIIFQNESRPLTSAGTSADWTLVTDVTRRPGGNGTRSFRMNLTQVSTGPAFTVEVADYGDTIPPITAWSMEVTGDIAGNTDVTVTVDPPSGLPLSSKSCTKSLDSPHAEINVTAGTVVGEPCAALQGSYRFAHGVGSNYNVSIDNGDQATGNYSLVTRNTTAWEQAKNDPNFQLNFQKSGGGAPYARAAIYNTTVTYEYRSNQLVYETQIRIAPGEPDE